MKSYKNIRSGRKSSIRSYSGMHNEHSSRFYSIQRAIIDIEEDLRRIKRTLRNYSGSRKIAFDKETALKYINYLVDSGMIDEELEKVLLERAEIRDLDQRLANKFRKHMNASQLLNSLDESTKEELREILCGK